MPNGTLFRLEVSFSPIHLTSISAAHASPSDATDLSKLTEEDLQITRNIVATIRRLADIIEKQGLDQHYIYGNFDRGDRRQIGEYFCRFRPE
jgi:hypothetical protein